MYLQEKPGCGLIELSARNRFIGTMKKITLLAALSVVFLTGCASTSTRYADEGLPASQLAFTPVTSPQLLVKWANQYPHIRAMDTFIMATPTDQEVSNAEVAEFRADMTPGSVYVEAAGGESPAYRVIRHTPHQR
jgi:hypothetical protein